MLNSLKATNHMPFIGLVGFLIANLVLIIQTIQVPEMSIKIPWLVITWGVGLSIFIWKVTDHIKQKRGVIVFGTIVLGIGLTYLLLVLLPADGFIIRLGKMGLVVLSGLVLLPFSYHISKNINRQVNPIEYGVTTIFPHEFSLTKPIKILIWGELFILILLFFVFPVFLRSDILGYDTPTYVLRARLLDKFGAYIHALYGGGYQITFPFLSSFIHQLTGINFIDVVRLLPPIMMAAICLTTGFFAYGVVRSQPYAIMVALFTMAWGLAPHLIVDARDNIAVMLFGSLGMVFLSKTDKTCSWFYEFLLLISLVLAGISHLSLSSIFILTTLLVNLLELYDSYWMGERKDFIRQLWKAIRVPLLSGIIIALIWLPVLGDFINSLGMGLRTHGELGETRDTTFGWIIKRYNLAVNLPWIVLGYLFVIWKVLSSSHSRNFKIVFVWSTICIIFGIVLKPISFLNSRFIAMIPTFLLVPLGFHFLWNIIPTIIQIKVSYFVQLGLIIIFGILLSSNLVLNSKLLFDIPGLPAANYQEIEYINKYIDVHHPPKPFIFLIEDSGKYSESNSDLWRRTIRSSITDAGLVDTYIYFGTLDFLLRGEQTPINENGLPQLHYEDAFSASGQRWFDELTKHRVFENQEMTVFIIKEFNPDIYTQYEYLPFVDGIAPGILVVNIPDELVDQNPLNRTNP